MAAVGDNSFQSNDETSSSKFSDSSSFYRGQQTSRITPVAAAAAAVTSGRVTDDEDFDDDDVMAARPEPAAIAASSSKRPSFSGLEGCNGYNTRTAQIYSVRAPSTNGETTGSSGRSSTGLQQQHHFRSGSTSTTDSGMLEISAVSQHPPGGRGGGLPPSAVDRWTSSSGPENHLHSMTSSLQTETNESCSTAQGRLLQQQQQHKPVVATTTTTSVSGRESSTMNRPQEIDNVVPTTAMSRDVDACHARGKEYLQRNGGTTNRARDVMSLSTMTSCCLEDGGKEQQQQQQQNYYEVELHRGSRGFGFSIRGGQEFDAMPLCVLNISKGGAADMDGRLQNDDHIVAINGQTTENMTHTAAANLILNSSSPLQLLVKRTNSVQRPNSGTTAEHHVTTRTSTCASTAGRSSTCTTTLSSPQSVRTSTPPVFRRPVQLSDVTSTSRSRQLPNNGLTGNYSGSNSHRRIGVGAAVFS
jgi:hypothetical protein